MARLSVFFFLSILSSSIILQQISALQSPFQGPGLSQSRSYKVIFHPATGLCVLRKALAQPLKLGSCSDSEAWNYTPQKTLTIKGTYFCLQADKLGKAAKLGIICTDSNSKWDISSEFSSELSDGTTVCLDVDSNNTIVTNSCKCLSGDDTCEPGSQEFKLETSTRSSAMAKPSLTN